MAGREGSRMYLRYTNRTTRRETFALQRFPAATQGLAAARLVQGPSVDSSSMSVASRNTSITMKPAESIEIVMIFRYLCLSIGCGLQENHRI